MKMIIINFDDFALPVSRLSRFHSLPSRYLHYRTIPSNLVLNHLIESSLPTIWLLPTLAFARLRLEILAPGRPIQQ